MKDESEKMTNDKQQTSSGALPIFSAPPSNTWLMRASVACCSWT